MISPAGLASPLMYPSGRNKHKQQYNKQREFLYTYIYIYKKYLFDSCLEIIIPTGWIQLKYTA